MSRKPVTHPNLIKGELRVGHTAADYGLYSTGLVQKFELGTRYRLGDRVFHYGKTNAAVVCQKGAKNSGAYRSVGGGVVTVTVVDQTWIDLLLDAIEGGATWFGTKNWMVGGMVVIHATGSNQKSRMIVGHQKGANLATIKVYLDGPLGSVVGATSMTEIAQNPYANLTQVGSEYTSVMGVPVITHAQYAFGWYQSWGPCWVVQNKPCQDEANWRQVIFNSDGSINSFDEYSGAAFQNAGFVIDAGSLGTDTPPFIMLQICP